jgi:hypothetical protein
MLLHSLFHALGFMQGMVGIRACMRRGRRQMIRSWLRMLHDPISTELLNRKTCRSFVRMISAASKSHSNSFKEDTSLKTAVLIISEFNDLELNYLSSHETRKNAHPTRTVVPSYPAMEFPGRYLDS